MLSLTATELPRYMTCNGSKLMGGISPFENDETDTDEGNAVHWLAEQGFKGISSPDTLINKQAENGVFITAEMIESCEVYLRDILALGGWVEVPTTWAQLGWEIRGRADHVAFVERVLYVNDFKYGFKIVEPEMNWTLISHAISVCRINPAQPVDKVVFRIYQPRPYHPIGKVREWHISYQELMELSLKLVAALTNPSNTVTTSEHCYRCPSLSQCPAGQISSMNSVYVSRKAFDSHVNNEQLSFMLDETNRAIKMLEQSRNAYEELAKHRIKSGQVIPEYSMQSDLSKTQWKDGLNPEIVKALVGVDLSKKQLITPTQAKKMGINEEVVTALSERVNTGFKLVRVDEKKRAQKMFGTN